MRLEIPLKHKLAIIEFTKAVKKELPDAKIYVFGSLARGDWLIDSDIDVIVVTECLKNLKPWERTAYLRRLAPKNIAFDIIVYTQKEFTNRRKYYEPLVECEM